MGCLAPSAARISYERLAGLLSVDLTDFVPGSVGNQRCASSGR